MIRTKHRAQRGYTNNGRVFYQYVTDADLTIPNSGKIGNARIHAGKKIEQRTNGNVIIGTESGVRRVHIGVDLKKAYRFDDHVKIGSIKADGSKPKLDLIETNVSLRAPLRVH